METERHVREQRNSSQVRVLVADRLPVVRYGVSLLLGGGRAFKLVGTAGTGGETIEASARTHPDVVLLDLRFSDLLAPEIITELRRKDPHVRTVVFTSSPEHAIAKAAVNAGAREVLSKDAGRGEIMHTLLAVAHGDRQPNSPRRRKVRGPITTREYDVLRRAALGQSTTEIAAAMYLSPNTVKGYMQNTLRKLDARNRIEAIAKARGLGLL
ncbi:response regulator transcription factor [Saccharopolyspora shandongensis]|uniref:Two component transcriptional regulator, LuxR family n=1 Tax=Saccharopolyspora shandongensis TaxID=418495 RepID=A0A1H3IYB7_9PSEU|nr:response regulator transcription factor [Saccharopolyspora shandongensis]SDY32701.1 two component transcriptional regulator, LuxR family [Saccharopolyspora shandongensis]